MNPPASDLHAQATSLTLDLVERHRDGRVVGARDGRVGMKLPLLLRDSRAVPLLDAGARRIEAILGPDVEALIAVRDCYLPEPGVSHSAAGQCAAGQHGGHHHRCRHRTECTGRLASCPHFRSTCRAIAVSYFLITVSLSWWFSRL